MLRPTLAILGSMILLAPLFSPASGAISAPALTFADKGGNSWWVEAIVTGADAALLSKVDARAGSGPWVPLTHESWGTWGASFYIAPGQLVTFQGTLADGRTLVSCPFTHPAGVAQCAAPAPAPAPAPLPTGNFTAAFSPRSGNSWWVETVVTSSSTIVSVVAKVNGGADVPLGHTSWGTWAKSFFVPTGANVTFAAISSTGARVTSPTGYLWPAATPIVGAAPPPAPTPTPTPTPVVSAPSAPTLTASAGVGNVTLSWNAPANGGAAITGYTLYRSTASGAQTLLATTGTNRTFTDKAVTAGVRVYYKVSATNSAGTGARSVEASAVPLAASTPTPPPPTPVPAPVPTTFAHTGITSTTFWVGEIFDPTLPDGSQVCSSYDSQWAYHWSGVNNGKVPSSAAGCANSIVGGCDGIPGANNACATERRTAANGYFPTSSLVHPLENPFYLDLPFADINDPVAFAERCQVIPWANQPGFAGHCTDRSFSYMKNHWVQIKGPNGNVCYGQIEDAGPSHGSLYHDANYVFGTTDAQPIQGNFHDTGMDVSPALNGCLGYGALDGDTDKVSWNFVDASQVPAGPWLKIVTTSPVQP